MVHVISVACGWEPDITKSDVWTSFNSKLGEPSSSFTGASDVRVYGAIPLSFFEGLEKLHVQSRFRWTVAQSIKLGVTWSSDKELLLQFR